MNISSIKKYNIKIYRALKFFWSVQKEIQKGWVDDDASGNTVGILQWYEAHKNLWDKPLSLSLFHSQQQANERASE